MKKLTGLLVILVVLSLGAYYGMGVLTERTIKKDIEVVNQSNGLSAVIENYNRGWFSSDANIKWRLHLPERIVKDAEGKSQTLAAQDYNTQTPIQIHHGPFIHTGKKLRFGMGYAQTSIPLPDQYNQKFDTLFTQDSMKPQLDLNIFVNYLNQSTLELALPSFKLTAKEGNGQFEWKGMNTLTSISSNLNKIDGKIRIDGADVSKDDTKINLGEVTSEYNLHKTASGLYLGDANLSLPSFTIMNKAQSLFAMKDFSLNSSSDISNSLFSTHLEVQLNSVVANTLTYGPAQLEVALRNLDADVLAKLNDQAQAMHNGTDVERQQAMLSMLPELPKLFSQGAEFEISKLNVKLPQGVVDGNLLVSLPKGNNSNPFELIQKIQGNAKLSLPIAVVKQLVQQSLNQQMTTQPELQQALIKELQNSSAQPAATPTPSAAANAPEATPPTTTTPAPTLEQLAVMETDKRLGILVQNGLLTVNADNYVIEVSLAQGKFIVNGKPFDPAMLKF